jgi:hypothetical protein
MRILKLCVIVVLLAAACQTAWAQTPPPYSVGTNQLKSRNQDNGTAYFITDLDAFINAGLFNTTLDPDNLPASVGSIKPDGAKPQAGSTELEDTWGIVHLYFIKPGELISNNTQVAGISGATAWDNSDGMEDTWVVGLFWGGNDTGVTFTNPSNQLQLTVDTDNVQFEMWAVDKATLAASATANGVGPIDPENLVSFNAANRSAVNRYDGWVDGVGIKLLTGVSTEFQFQGTISSDGQSFGGQTSGYFDIDENDASGLWNWMWGNNSQLVSLVNGITSDAYFTWDLGNSNQGWDVASTDLGGVTTVIPEPLTMIGLMIGIGSVGGYLRRRTRMG